jgi:hypothetical protein
MQTNAFESPVALFVFNRPECTKRVFDAIAQTKPRRLLLIADGPRPGHSGDAELCQQVRDLVTAVDWPCDFSTNFASANLGCQERFVTGLDWAFSLVEEAIILEDDCLPDPSFFPFCAELLDRYRGDSRVASISGTSLVKNQPPTDASYWFSELGGNWGWATWKSEWQRFDRNVSDWPTLRKERALDEIFGKAASAYWTSIFDAMYERKSPDVWDYQWIYSHLKNHSVNVMPRINLVTNIGFGAGATHTQKTDARLMVPSQKIEFPLRHPISLIPLRGMDRRYHKVLLGSAKVRLFRYLRSAAKAHKRRQVSPRKIEDR